jgi:hypothetical protein
MKLASALAVSAFIAAGCGGGSQAAAGGDVTVGIDKPADGADVKVPFELALHSSEPLGPTDSGEDHVHVWFDGHEDEYEVVTGDHVEVDDLPAGEHTITASLRNADHSAAGAETTITVTVSKGAGDGSGGGGDSGDDGGYNY